MNYNIVLTIVISNLTLVAMRAGGSTFNALENRTQLVHLALFINIVDCQTLFSAAELRAHKILRHALRPHCYTDKYKTKGCYTLNLSPQLFHYNIQ